jgi:hypothetical protein
MGKRGRKIRQMKKYRIKERKEKEEFENERLKQEKKAFWDEIKKKKKRLAQQVNTCRLLFQSLPSLFHENLILMCIV